MNHFAWFAWLVFLILLAAFFSAAETGMMALNRYRLRHLARKGVVAAKRVAALLERPDRVLGGILLGSTFASILAAAIATTIAVYYFGDLGILIAPVSLTIMMLIIGETAPKTFSAIYPEKVAFFLSLPLTIFLKIAYPIVWLINHIVKGILFLLGVQVKQRVLEPVSIEELRTIVLEAGGKISPNYQQMLMRILELEMATVEDVMVPRHEIIGIDLDDTWEHIFQQMTTSRHSYLPLYQENMDTAIGMLNLRKVLAEMSAQKMLDKKTLQRLADEIYYIPEGAQLHRQLLNFHEQRQTIGLVVDEYGDIQGLLSIQDVLTEIVGEVAGDLEDSAKMVQKQSDGSVLVDGRIPLRDLNRFMHWKLPVDGPKTLSGLIIENTNQANQAK